MFSAFFVIHVMFLARKIVAHSLVSFSSYKLEVQFMLGETGQSVTTEINSWQGAQECPNYVGAQDQI